MDMITLHSIVTVLTVFSFLWLVIWAWSGKNKKLFDEMARMPFEEDEMIFTDTNSEEQKDV